MTSSGVEPVRRSRFAAFWREHRARWTLPLVIIVIIAAVAVIDHVGSRRISQAVEPHPPPLVAAANGTTAVYLDQPWSGFNPSTPAGAASSTPSLLSSVLPSAYVLNPKLVPQVNGDLLESVEVTSTSPLTLQYVINPRAVWSDGVAVTVDDFVYAWRSQKGDGVDVDGKPDQVASTIGYRDVASVSGSNGGKTVTVVFSRPFTDWRILFNGLLPAHVASRVGWNSGFSRFDPTVDLSAGPMILQSATSTSAVLVRNPHWWGAPASLTKVAVSVDSSPSGWLGDVAGRGQMVAQVNSFNLSTLDSVTSIPTAASTVKSSLSFLELDFDTKSMLMVRPELRQAVAHAIDRTALLSATLLQLDPGLQVSNDLLATPSQGDYNPSSTASGYAVANEQTTDQLLKSLGYRQAASGAYVDAGGRPLVLRMTVETGDPWIEHLATEVAAQLRTSGIGVQLQSVDGPSGMAAAAAAGSYDLALVTRKASPYQTVTAGWYSDTPGVTGTGVASATSSASGQTGTAAAAGTEDWTRFSDPQVDQLFLQASQALNPVTGGTIYTQINNLLWSQMVALPLFEEPVLETNGVRIAAVQFNPSTNGLFWNVAAWTALKPGPTNQKA